MLTGIIGGIIGALLVEAVLRSPKAMSVLKKARDKAKDAVS